MDRESEEDQDKYGWTHSMGIRAEPSAATWDETPEIERHGEELPRLSPGVGCDSTAQCDNFTAHHVRIRAHTDVHTLRNTTIYQPSHVLRSDVSSYPVRHSHRNPPMVLTQVWGQLCEPRVHSSSSGEEKTLTGFTYGIISSSRHIMFTSLACKCTHGGRYFSGRKAWFESFFYHFEACEFSLTPWRHSSLCCLMNLAIDVGGIMRENIFFFAHKLNSSHRCRNVVGINRSVGVYCIAIRSVWGVRRCMRPSHLCHFVIGANYHSLFYPNHCSQLLFYIIVHMKQ